MTTTTFSPGLVYTTIRQWCRRWQTWAATGMALVLLLGACALFSKLGAGGVSRPVLDVRHLTAAALGQQPIKRAYYVKVSRFSGGDKVWALPTTWPTTTIARRDIDEYLRVEYQRKIPPGTNNILLVNDSVEIIRFRRPVPLAELKRGAVGPARGPGPFNTSRIVMEIDPLTFAFANQSEDLSNLRTGLGGSADLEPALADMLEFAIESDAFEFGEVSTYANGFRNTTINGHPWSEPIIYRLYGSIGMVRGNLIAKLRGMRQHRTADGAEFDANLWMKEKRTRVDILEQALALGELSGLKTAHNGDVMTWTASALLR